MINTDEKKFNKKLFKNDMFNEAKKSQKKMLDDAQNLERNA